MKPAAFDYVRAESVEHAVQALAGAGGDGKVIAGGQSLMPMMNFRLVKPSILVDINAIPALDRIERNGNRISFGALVRHRMTAENPLVAEHVPILHHAMKHVAHLTVRNRGTFCGSLCHADPAAEMPMIAQLLNAEIHVLSSSGKRMISAKDFFTGSLMTALEPDELVTSVQIDSFNTDIGWGFEEFSRRHGDYALAAVGVTMSQNSGLATDVRIAVMGVAETAIRVPQVEALFEGKEMSRKLVAEGAELLRSTLEPNTDLHASSDYRRYLSGELMLSAVHDAWRRVGGNSLQ